MTGPDQRVTAYWYASQHGLPCDLDYLLQLGLAAARRARWEGIAPLYVAEGPLRVHTWPERIWRESAGRPGNREEFTREREPGFWSYPAPPEDTQAYVDWMYMAQEEDRILSGAYGPDEQIPWDGDDIRPD